MNNEQNLGPYILGIEVLLYRVDPTTVKVFRTRTWNGASGSIIDLATPFYSNPPITVSNLDSTAIIFEFRSDIGGNPGDRVTQNLASIELVRQ